MASTARTVVLAQALHMAREPVKSFLESAGNGPLAKKAAETVATAAAAFPLAHDAVQRAVAAAGGPGAGVAAGAAAAVEISQGGGGGLPRGPSREGKTVEEPGAMDSAAMNEFGAGRGQTHVARVEEKLTQGRRGGGDGSGVGAAVGEEVLAMGREDSAARVSACQEAIESWWEQQRAAMEEGLRDREAEAADRRCFFICF